MCEINKKFVDKNKEALLQELGSSLNSLADLMANVYSQDPSENVQLENAFLRNVLIAAAQSVGYMTALFNQYWIFETGDISSEKKNSIGFVGLNEQIKKKKEKD